MLLDDDRRRFLASSIRRSVISSITPIQTPSVGSSSSRSFGSPSMARPIASILRSPPESVPAGWSSRWPSFGKMASTRSTASASACRASRPRDCRAPRAARTPNAPAAHSRCRARTRCSVAQRADVAAVEGDLARQQPAVRRRWSSSAWSCRRRCVRARRRRRARECRG